VFLVVYGTEPSWIVLASADYARVVARTGVRE